MNPKPKPGIILHDVMDDRDHHLTRAKVRRRNKNRLKVKNKPIR